MSRKTSWERTIDSLREQLKEEQAKTRRLIQAKNEALENNQQGLLFDLSAEYTNLKPLIVWLRKASSASVPLRSPAGDGRSTNNPSPLETGLATKGARGFVKSVDKRLGHLVEFIEENMGPKGKLVREEKTGTEYLPVAPQCWNAQCPARGWSQTWDAKECRSCGEAFTQHKPLKDLTVVRTKGRCWSRSCSRRGRTFYGVCPECGSPPVKKERKG